MSLWALQVGMGRAGDTQEEVEKCEVLTMRWDICAKNSSHLRPMAMALPSLDLFKHLRLSRLQGHHVHVNHHM